MKIQESDINPSASNAENARRLGVDPSSVSRARERLGLPKSPKTKCKLTEAVKRRRAEAKAARSYARKNEEWSAGIDWRRSNLELSLMTGKSVAQVTRRRARHAPGVKPYTIRETIERLLVMENKIAERATGHGWLNRLGVPCEERGLGIFRGARASNFNDVDRE